MLRPDDVLTTTTACLEGYEVEAHLGITTAHLVSGPSLTSDMERIFSPVSLNGRPSIDEEMRRSQEKLAEVDKEVLLQLKRKAARIGGNGIVGMHIERTHIAGQKGSMLLTVATGTAVRVRKVASKNGAHDLASPTVSHDKLTIEFRKQRVLDALDEGELPPPSDVEFLTDQRVWEAAPRLIAPLDAWMRQNEGKAAAPEAYYAECKRSFKRYFMRIGARHVKDVLYPAVETGNGPLARLALEILEERRLFDARRIEALLDANEKDRQQAGLRLLGVPKSRYVEDDLEVLSRLLEKAREMVEEADRMLSDCDGVVRVLEERIEVLERLFGGRRASSVANEEATQE